ncbi:MAG: hypothetical protein M1826_002929 [Phylliscum demangeonii]|nr:MAG: hypothetical protein M1826_002929 [Phylliscum demangeonii]
MAGKRLLDALALLHVSRAVFRQHLALRSHQWQVYSQTSSLMAVLRPPTDRVVRTVQAAASSLTSRQPRRWQDGRPSTTEPTTTTTTAAKDVGGGRSGHDSLAVRPDETRAANQTAQTPPQSGFPIPARAAAPVSHERADPVAERLAADHDQDVFYARTKHTAPSGLSEMLPAATIPEHADDAQAQAPIDRVGGTINSDVFYAAGASSPHEHRRVPETQAVPEQDQIPPQGVNTDVFHSPRVAKLLGRSADGVEQDGSESELKLEKASGTPVDHTALATGRDQDTFTVRRSEQRQSTVSEPSVDERDGRRSGDEHKRTADTAPGIEHTSHPAEVSAGLEGPLPARNQMHESQVPSSRVGRFWHYGSLATGMALGAVSEGVRRATGGRGDGAGGGSLMMSAANMDRLVAKLSRMRGAALKLGQMISLQDSNVLPPAIMTVLQRVQDSADYMPRWQRDQVLASNLGADWRALFSSFDEMPMAAASIGQVHGAVMRATGQRVAVKIQYPGVAASIDSDLSNLAVLLTASRLLPPGLYLEKTIANARTELAWECDYVREAACARRFQQLLGDADADVFVVPDIVAAASGREVLTMQRLDGVAVTKAVDRLTQPERDWIGTQVMRLCLREMMEFRFMQTDPNWTNFLYNRATHKIELLDFGASRAYPAAFIDAYVSLLEAAALGDRPECERLSRQLGYLTGLESGAMLRAHLDSVLTLAEPFRPVVAGPDGRGTYDFSHQTITGRVRALIPLMLRERLTPPPEETYSLHRKFSGAFLLCARLGSRVPGRAIFDDGLRRWRARREREEREEREERREGKGEEEIGASERLGG